mgnify:CR=1 FL=1
MLAKRQIHAIAEVTRGLRFWLAGDFAIEIPSEGNMVESFVTGRQVTGDQAIGSQAIGSQATFWSVNWGASPSTQHGFR